MSNGLLKDTLSPTVAPIELNINALQEIAVFSMVLYSQLQVCTNIEFNSTLVLKHCMQSRSTMSSSTTVQIQ